MTGMTRTNQIEYRTDERGPALRGELEVAQLPHDCVKWSAFRVLIDCNFLQVATL